MLHITNWKYADVTSAVAAADMPMGSVCVVDDSGLNRRLTVIGNNDDALALPGNLAIAGKVSSDPNEVNSSTVPARLGTRIVAIKSGDDVMEIRRGSRVEYSADLLDNSLNPSSSGTSPAIGDALGIKGGKWCVWADNAIGSTPFARVYKVFGTNVVVELL